MIWNFVSFRRKVPFLCPSKCIQTHHVPEKNDTLSCPFGQGETKSVTNNCWHHSFCSNSKYSISRLLNLLKRVLITRFIYWPVHNVTFTAQHCISEQHCWNRQCNNYCFCSIMLLPFKHLSQLLNTKLVLLIHAHDLYFCVLFTSEM